MAAIDLRRGLQHGGRRWGPERADPAGDGFDSEMQEWEEQLQDMQKKIEQLYNEVQARRGAGSDITADKHANGDGLADVVSGPRHAHVAMGNSLVASATATKHRGSDLTRRGLPPGHRAAGAGPRDDGGYGHQRPTAADRDGVASEIGDLLQDYLGHGRDVKRRNNGARRVHFNDTVAVSRELPKHQDRTGIRSVEETENQKNRASHARGSTDKENSCAKPPLRQRDPSPSAAARPAPAAQPRPSMHCDSPVLDRKFLGAAGAGLGDRKCGSPSVLRKFGAMLHENEGKTLTDSGVLSRPADPPPDPPRRAPPPHATSPKPRPRDAEGAGAGGRRGGGACYGGQPRGGPAPRAQRGRAEGPDRLLEQQYGSPPPGPAHRLDPRQFAPAESSTATQANAFSRPARPANQRPPSRWAGRTPTAKISAPSGLLSRPHSPVTHPASPAPKHRPAVCYARQVETVIM